MSETEAQVSLVSPDEPQHVSPLLSQVRRAIQQMLFPNKTFNWPRHVAIAVVLLSLINLLVIFAPNILGIFGIIGRSGDTSEGVNRHRTLTVQGCGQP